MTMAEAREKRKLLEKAVQSLDDSTALRMAEFYPKWESGQDYPEGYKVRRGVSLHPRHGEPGLQRPCRSGGAVCGDSVGHNIDALINRSITKNTPIPT